MRIREIIDTTLGGTGFAVPARRHPGEGTVQPAAIARRLHVPEPPGHDPSVPPTTPPGPQPDREIDLPPLDAPDEIREPNDLPPDDAPEPDPDEVPPPVH